jgi:hypothetical protein
MKADGEIIKTQEHVFAPKLYLVDCFSYQSLLVYFGVAANRYNGLAYQSLQVFTKKNQGRAFRHCGKVIFKMLKCLVFCTSKMSMG